MPTYHCRHVDTLTLCAL